MRTCLCKDPVFNPGIPIKGTVRTHALGAVIPEHTVESQLRMHLRAMLAWPSLCVSCVMSVQAVS